MAIDFPSQNLQVGQTHSENGKQWEWDGVSWNVVVNANNYTLPIASDVLLGGIKVGDNLTIDSTTGVLDAEKGIVDLSVVQNPPSGTGVLSFNGSTGILTYTPPTVSGGGGGIDLTDLSVSSNSASGGGSLSYNNSTGIFTYTPPDLSSYLTGLPAHTHTLVDLTDTSLINSDSPSDGDSLVYRGSDQKWRPVAISGGGGGGIDLTDLSVTSNSVGTAALSYNNTSGVFTYTPPDLSGYALAAHSHTYALNDLSNVNVASPTDGHVLKYDASAFSGSGGWISAPDQTSTGGAGISLTDLSVTQAAANAGGSLSYNNTNGVFTYTPPVLNTYGNSDARSALSVTVQSPGNANLEYNNSTGVFTYTPPTITTYTNTDARGAISLITNAASGGGSLSYNNSTGAFTYAPADLSGLSSPDLSNYVKKTDNTHTAIARNGANSYFRIDGDSYFAVDVDAQIQFETSAQFQVDATNQITLDSGTYIQTKSQWIEFKDSAGSNSLFRADAGSSVVLFNNGTWRLETKGDGVKINGGIQDKDGDLGTPGQVLSSTGTGLDWVNPGSMSKSDLSVVVQSPGTANLSYNDSSGVFTYTPPTIVNYTNQNARGALSVTVQSAGTPNLTYNNSTGVFTYTPPNITSYTNQDARGAISLSKQGASGGGDLDYNSSSGVFTYKPADVQSGARQSLSVQNSAAGSTAQLSYNSSTGLFTYTPLNTTGLGGLQATRVSQWANSPYTSSNPYNPNIDGDAEGFLVIIIGGGGGAGIALGTSTQGAASGGGGGGGSVLWFYSPAEMGTACYWTIGAAGSSPTSGLNAGQNGGTSYFYTNGSGPNLTANGGQGSSHCISTGNFTSGGGAGGGGTWVTIGNDTNCVMRGSNGDTGIAVANNSSCHSGQAGYAVQGPGTSGSNWGRGAWGAKSNNSNWGSAGGNALEGIITIYKF